MWQITLLLQVLCVFARNVPRAGDEFSLNVIHMNDFHARFEEVADNAGVCKDENCIGGFSRMYSKINDILETHSDSLLLNAGDNFQGTLWYTLFKWNVTQYFFNKLNFDAIVLGNHEFDDGIAGVVPFIEHLTAPVVCANIDDSLEPTIQNIYKKSVVVERDGKKIGIVGVILKSTNTISSSGNLVFGDESEAANAEAERLVREEGVFTNIVLSHSGYDVEKDIARKATTESKISLIVGGHSHTFLYTGTPSPGPGSPQGPYPTIVERTDTKQVLVVQASAYNRYLGNITVFYDENGDCVDWSGEPIFLDTETRQDEEINAELEPWKEGVDNIGTQEIGSSLVELSNYNCYNAECMLGNFVADAMVHSYLDTAEEDYWTYAALAVTNPGGLRTTVAKGVITYGDMVTAIPFENTMDVGEIEGRYLRALFENTTSLLQVSGMKIVYNTSLPVGSRIESFKIRCNECRVPVYEELQLDKTYRLILNSFLRTGGDGFGILNQYLTNIKIGRVDIDIVVEYLAVKSPVFQEIEGRLVFVK